MRATRVWVHFGSCSGARLCSSLHEREYFTRRPDSPLTKTFNKEPSPLVLPNLKRSSLVLQQIRNNVIVDLEVAGSHHKRCSGVALILNVAKYLLHCSRDDSSVRITSIVTEALHCMSFPSPCLAIREECCIVSFESTKHSLLSSMRVNFSLSRIYIVNSIERESMLLHQMRVIRDIPLPLSLTYFSSQILKNSEGFEIRAYSYDWLKRNHCVDLALKRWSCSDHNFEIFSVFSILRGWGG